MNIQDWGALGEMIGAIAIIISLIYVGLQVRQTTKAVRLNTAHDVADDCGGVYALIAQDLAIADIWLRGLTSIETVLGAERTQFYSLLHTFFKAFENAHYQMMEGALDKKQWAAMAQQFLWLKDFSGMKAYWPERKFIFSEEFQEYFDREVATVPASGIKLAGS